MEPITSSLLNLGGTGVLAAALLWLHQNAIKAFREELREERELCAQQFDRIDNRLDSIERKLP